MFKKIRLLLDTFSLLKEERKVREELERLNRELSEQKYALDQHAIVAITDVGGKIIYANDKFCEISQYSREELLGQDHRVVNSGYHSKEFMCELWQTIAHGKVWKGEIRNKARDGSFYWLNTTIVPFLNDDGRPYQYMAVRVDISDRKKAEEKLTEVIKTKSKFISMVSHELRTPLTAIKEGINIVYEGEAGPINPEQKDFLKLSKRNVDRLARLIDDVLSFQKLQAGKVEFYNQECCLNELAGDVYKIMKPLAKEKNLNFRIVIDQALPKVVFDSDKILQVMTNLVSNAIKYTDQGSIEMTTSTSQQGVCFVVTDTGLGFRPEDQSRLFQSFERLGNKEGKTEGTGLGLVISKEIIDRHNGKIWATSTHGEGAAFGFMLPLQHVVFEPYYEFNI